MDTSLKIPEKNVIITIALWSGISGLSLAAWSLGNAEQTPVYMYVRWSFVDADPNVVTENPWNQDQRVFYFFVKTMTIPLLISLLKISLHSHTNVI